jgi:uncharacterized protein (TIGR00369 family)
LEKPLPYSEWCYVCGKDNPLGFRIVFFTEDGRTVRARYRPEIHRQGYLSVIHGGVLSTLLDETMAWAPTLHTGRMYVTGELTVRYHLPFPVGRTMIIDGWSEKVSRRMAITAGEVRDEGGTRYATAGGKYLPMTAEETRKVQELLIYEPDTLKVFDRL